MTFANFSTWCKWTVLMIGFCFVSYQLHAQDTGTRLDSLENRIKKLEVRFDTVDSRLTQQLGLPRSFTRSEVESGEIPSRVMVSVGNTKLQIGGFIQGDVIYSFREPGPFKDFMVPHTIPVPNTGDGEFFLGVRQTRFYTKSETQTPLGVMKTHFEFDLYGGRDQSTTFFLRHAWGTLGRLGVGHFWSNFMDIDVFPNIFEYWGPNSMPFVRQPQIRYTINLIPDKLRLALSAEKPGNTIQLDTPRISKRVVYPDGVASLRMQWGSEDRHGISHVKLASLLHPISYKENGDKNTLLGYGFNFSALIQLYSKNNITLEATYGKGIARYIDDHAFMNYDAVLNPSNEFETMRTYGGFLFYNFWWTDNFSTSLGGSYQRADTFSSQPGTDYQDGQYAIANFIYYPTNSVKMGIEYQYGRRNNINDESGNNSRLQFSAQYKF